MFKVKKIKENGGVKNKFKGSHAVCHPEKKLAARGMCKNCYSKWLLKHNPEFAKRQRENVKKWISTHMEQRKAHLKRWGLKRDPLYNRIRALKHYGMTISDYDNMLKKQKGVCFICQKPPKKGKSLHVDHDHNTGYVRGLLCFRCNFGLSYFNEDKEIVKRVYDYMCKVSEN
jgi:hypothetical protein